MAAFQLNVRLAEARLRGLDVFEDAETVARFLIQRYRIHDREIFGALFFAGSRLIASEVLFKGAGFACSVDVRVVMRRAILLSASSMSLWHCHPAGNPEPGLHDVEFTKRVARAGDHLEVPLLDHLIVTPDGQFMSMRQQRCW